MVIRLYSTRAQPPPKLQTDTVFLVADSSKIGKNSFASLGALSLIDYLITDSKVNENDLAMFKQHDIKFLIAEDN
jgi:DeoR/GlpR family transcriptional regulator of sugar metabolism